MIPSAPSIHVVELKNMPWWWRLVGWSRPLVTCRIKESVVLTSSGGGLFKTIYSINSVFLFLRGWPATYGHVSLTPMTLRANSPSGLTSFTQVTFHHTSWTPAKADEAKATREKREEDLILGKEGKEWWVFEKGNDELDFIIMTHCSILWWHHMVL